MGPHQRSRFSCLFVIRARERGAPGPPGPQLLKFWSPTHLRRPKFFPETIQLRSVIHAVGRLSEHASHKIRTRINLTMSASDGS